jgi:hypothetical protein
VTTYLLIRQLPGTGEKPGTVTAHSMAFATPARAARVAAQVLHDCARVPKSTALKLTAHLARAIGITWTDVYSGYRFRILQAHYTDDGVPITPGLKVRTKDNWWGIVYPDQFLADGLDLPGGKFFDGFYYVHPEGDVTGGKKYNGERLSTKDLA